MDGTLGTLVGTPNDLKELYEFYVIANAAVLKQIDFWHVLNVLFQVSSVALGIAATLFMALQNEKNKRWTKPLGIITTTLITGIVTVYNVFHIKENIDKLLDIQMEVVLNANELYFYTRENPGKEDFQVQKKYTEIINRLGNERRRTVGSIGIQRAPAVLK